MLQFSVANAKTEALYAVPDLAPFLGKIGRKRRKVYSLDLSSGWSCPGAKDCLSKVVAREDDPTRFTIQDGPKCVFRCFSASQEVYYAATRKLRKFNFDLLRYCRGWEKCRDMLLCSFPDDLGVLRFHVAGDFFKLAYFRGAVEAAKARPDIRFYAYTKSLRWLESIPMLEPARGRLLENFMLTASRGGKYDNLIEDLNLREARVVFSESEAASLRLAIDHDDSHAATRGGSFALLIHGTQPAGSDASAALAQLKGKGSYRRDNRE